MEKINEKTREQKSPFPRWLRPAPRLQKTPDDDSIEPELVSEAKQRSLHRRLKPYFVSAVIIVIVVSIAWVLSSIYFSKIIVAKTTMPARASNAMLGASLDRQAATYRLTIQHPDGTKKQYSLNKLGITLDRNATIKATRQHQQAFMQRLKWWQPLPAQIVLKSDRVALNSFIAAEASVTVQPPRDAVLSIENGEIRLSDAITGTYYGLIQPRKTFLAAAGRLQSSTIKLNTLTVNPALTAKILEPYKAGLEKILNQPVSFNIGYKTVNPSPVDIASWLEITPDDKTRKVDIRVNSGKVVEYINIIASRYIYPAKAQIEARQPDGSTQILVPGVNGVDVTNKTDTAAEVARILQEGKGIHLPLPVSYEPFQTITAGSYAKWIEVDLTHKRLYAYEKNNLVNTQLVTAGAPGTPTVTGQYAIYSKYDQQDMRGSNVDGSRYFQPHVRWINYFYRDYAIHGNYWRPLSYFGNINSSHGCVSAVESEAAWLYTWAPIGTPVVIHQ